MVFPGPFFFALWWRGMLPPFRARPGAKRDAFPPPVNDASSGGLRRHASLGHQATLFCQHTEMIRFFTSFNDRESSFSMTVELRSWPRNAVHDHGTPFSVTANLRSARHESKSAVTTSITGQPIPGGAVPPCAWLSFRLFLSFRPQGEIFKARHSIY
jgi:hypothetical protein